MEKFSQGVRLAGNATVVGDVTLGQDVNIWYGAVLRGDSGSITVGQGTNIQDNCVIHENTVIGSHCTIGHGAILHGCTIGDETLVGMGAIVLTGAQIGSRCLIGAGALVTGKTQAPEGSVLLGSPAKVVKTLTAEQMAAQLHDAQHYVETAKAQLIKK
jgi:carbonic anhydrase/acetyltransferase-like protein (isoleucine patch superfamily)